MEKFSARTITAYVVTLLFSVVVIVFFLVFFFGPKSGYIEMSTVEAQQQFNKECYSLVSRGCLNITSEHRGFCYCWECSCNQNKCASIPKETVRVENNMSKENICSDNWIKFKCGC